MNSQNLYKHLSDEQLIQIEALQKAGLRQYKISVQIGCNKSTISRLFRSYKLQGIPFDAQSEINRRDLVRYQANQYFHKIKPGSELSAIIIEKLKTHRSPEQIVFSELKAQGFEISIQTVYDFIYENHPELVHKFFRRKGKKYKHGKTISKHIPNRIGIEERPEIVQERTRLGDFECDTICGKGHKDRVVTNVDRVARYLIAGKLRKMLGLAGEVAVRTMELFKGIPKDKRLTFTYDNGIEFKDHETIARGLGVKTYFARPYSPRERGTNENTNGLLREFIPKGTDLDTVSDEQLAYYVHLINTRPRKILGRKTPYEIFRGKKYDN